MTTFLKSKFVPIAIVALLVVLTVFGLAMMGSVLGAKPKALPVALAVLDRPAELPTGEQLALGEAVKGNLLGLEQLPVEWRTVGSEEEALEAMNGQEVYGALVLPADFSAGVLSVSGPEPAPATVKIYLNEGMNPQGVSAVRTILQQVAGNVSRELTRQVLEQVGQRAEQVPVWTVQALLAPVQIEETSVNPVGANNGSGSAPNMLTQIVWMGTLVLSVLLFQAVKSAREAGGRWGALSGQALTGIVFAIGASGFLVWMATAWYGMELTDSADVWLFLSLAAIAFFLMQSALFNWLGLPAVALLVLLLFFSLPILNLAPEFMPQATRDWLYSWTPFRYVASGLRNVMYFGGEREMGLSHAVLWSLAGISLAVLLAAGFRKGPGRAASRAAESRGEMT